MKLQKELKKKETKNDGDEGNEKRRIRSLIWFVLVLSLHSETFDLSHNHKQ